MEILDEAFARTLEVGGDLRITGSQLQFEASDCSEPGPAGEGHVCYDGDRLLVSENGGPYSDLEGAPGRDGRDGAQGDKGDPGEPGGTARLWVPDDQVYGLEGRRALVVLGAGFPESSMVTISVVNPGGSESTFAREAETDASGAFVWYGNLYSFAIGTSEVRAYADDGALQATHPIHAFRPEE